MNKRYRIWLIQTKSIYDDIHYSYIRYNAYSFRLNINSFLIDNKYIHSWYFYSISTTLTVNTHKANKTEVLLLKLCDQSV